MHKMILAALAFALVLGVHAGAQAQTRAGSFTGASQHETSGSVFVAGDALSLGRNFRFDGAPDPKLAFGTARSADKATIFAPLKKNSGAQNYRIPNSIDAARYTHVWLWCERFGVPLGVAPLAAR